MEKEKLMNVDLQPVADVGNNLINKLANGIGWIATPKGKKAHQIEAQDYLIEQIKKDENMPPLAKAASISNVKKIIREYSNQNDIVYEAMTQLMGDANPHGVDNEWLSIFMDYCKNVEAEDVKAIWVKVLAEECNQNKSIPKKLLTILATISNENARAFSSLCLFAINMPLKKDKDFYELSLFGDMFEMEYQNHGVYYGKLLELESMGLINLDSDVGYYMDRECLMTQNDKYRLTYYGSAIELSNINAEFRIGNVVFTDAGRALFSIIGAEAKGEVFEVLEKGIRAHNEVLCL